jgi:hypothetical protein
MDHLPPDLIRYVGVAFAVLGSCAAAPAATWKLVRAAPVQGEKLFRTVFRRHRHGVAHGSVAVGSAIGISGQVRAIVKLGPDATVERRLIHLEEWMARLDTEVGEVARLEQWLDHFEDETTQVNARALPVIGLGILLSGIPYELAHYRPLGIITAGFGLVLAV